MNSSEPRRRKSSRPGTSNNCVEVADGLPDRVLVRDSKDAAGPVLTVEPAAWTAFVGLARRGRGLPGRDTSITAIRRVG